MPNGGDWRSLVSGTMAQDIARERASPIAGMFSQVIKAALAMGKERRAEAGQARTTARTAAYSAYPEKAAEEIGMDVPTGAPEGMRKTKVARGGVTYEAPEPLDQQFFAKEFGKFRTSIEETNATLKLMNKPTIKVPKFREWMEESFPEYASEVLKGVKKAKKIAEEEEAKLSAEEWLKNNGYATTPENIKALKKANPGVFD